MPSTDGTGTVGVRLPGDIAAVEKILLAAYRKVTTEVEARVRGQAERTVWKIMDDWVRVQVSLIQLKQVEFEQVFLAYLSSGSTTFYQIVKESKFKGLLGPRKE